MTALKAIMCFLLKHLHVASPIVEFVLNDGGVGVHNWMWYAELHPA